MPSPTQVLQATRTAATAAAAQARQAAGTVYAAHLRPTEGAGRLARLAYGAGLPLALARALLADPSSRRRYLRTCALQAAVTVAFSLALVLGSDGSGEAPGDTRTTVHIAWSGAEVSSEPGSLVSSEVESGAGKDLVFWSSLYGVLCVLEWLVISMSFEHHDAIGHDAARLTGIPPEDPPLVPRVRLNLRWMRKRLGQKLRAFRVFAAGFPLLVLLIAVPVLGGVLYGVATAAWAAYWLSVFVGARSSHAWKEETTAGPPWFLRVWERFTQEVPGFRWWLPRAYGRLWRRLTAAVFSPAARFEQSSYELAGLTLIRALCSLPGMYVFMRPLVPVAAAQILLVAEPPGSGRSPGAPA